MSGLAKVFIVINFVLAIVFLSGAGVLLHKTDEWKVAFEAEEAAHATTKKEKDATIQEVSAQRDNLQKGYDQLTNDVNDEKNAVQKLTSDLSDERQASKELRDSVNKLQESFDNMEGNQKASTDRIAELTSQVDSERSRANDAVNKQMSAEDERTRLQAELSNANDRLAQYEADVEMMRKANEDLSLQVAAAVSAGFDPNELTAAPAINGVIKAVDNSTGVFILSVGSDDGVKKGYKFFVYRGNEYLGEVYVDQVQSDLCSAVAREPLAGAVQAMDSVTTRL